ncbi:hypothetical protein VZT92_010517 [Zoarces viviparus]|uniref:Uncharacterized protein n=1 Tax=Zoarces viviparus TaxID=48416 RepID=A0AAW1F815_ZOAVI
MLGGHGGVREEQRQRAESPTSRHYTPIPARLPDTRTRPKGLVNLKARVEGGGALAGVCQEETASTKQSGRQEAAREGKGDRQRQRAFKDASSFFLLFLLALSGVT